MHNTKIVKLLKSLDQYEIRQFKDFVYSPIFNKNENVTKLYNALKKFYPKFEADGLSDELIFKQVFPKEKFDYFKLRNTVSDLFSLGKEFLSFLKYRKSNHIKDKFLLFDLRVRSLDNIFEQVYKTTLKQNEDTKIKDETYLLNKLDLTEENICYITPKRPNENIHLQQDKLNIFIRYSLLRFLKFYNLMLHEEKQNDYKYDLGMFDEVMNYIEKKNIDDTPALLVYYNIILLEKKREDKYFYNLKALNEKYQDELGPYDRYMIFMHMNGYCTNVYNTLCRTDLLREQFNIVKGRFEIDPKVLGKILYPDFLNEVKIAVRVNEFEWAENYIEKYKDRLEEEKESTLNFCYGLLNYKRGNHDEALTLFSKTYFPNFIIKLQVKIFQLQINYEMEYYDQAISMIDSFRHYLKRENTIKEDFKESFYEYLRLTNDLIKLRSGYSGNEKNFYREKLRKEIDAMKSNQFGIKLWLIEMVNGEW